MHNPHCMLVLHSCLGCWPHTLQGYPQPSVFLHTQVCHLSRPGHGSPGPSNGRELAPVCVCVCVWVCVRVRVWVCACACVCACVCVQLTWLWCSAFLPYIPLLLLVPHTCGYCCTVSARKFRFHGNRSLSHLCLSHQRNLQCMFQSNCWHGIEHSDKLGIVLCCMDLQHTLQGLGIFESRLLQKQLQELAALWLAASWWYPPTASRESQILQV